MPSRGVGDTAERPFEPAVKLLANQCRGSVKLSLWSLCVMTGLAGSSVRYLCQTPHTSHHTPHSVIKNHLARRRYAPDYGMFFHRLYPLGHHGALLGIRY